MTSFLLTPGPLTTRPEVRTAMGRDWGSRDPTFVELTVSVTAGLERICNAGETHDCVLLQGSGTFAIEAALRSFVSSTDRLLVLANGSYGDRITDIAKRCSLLIDTLKWPDREAIDPAIVDQYLTENPHSYVAMVHCETSTGLLNPLEQVAEVVERHGRLLLVDAMSTFGAMPIDLQTTAVAVLVSASGKCLEGVPGVGFVIARKELFAASRHPATSLALDLIDQWRQFHVSGQWRFTPPVQVVAALSEALQWLEVEGGREARLLRYRTNHAVLVAAMEEQGISAYLDSALQSPIIAAFQMPADLTGMFDRVYSDLSRCGYLIYPGKLTTSETFRVGCIGVIDEAVMSAFVTAFAHCRMGIAMEEISHNAFST